MTVTMTCLCSRMSGKGLLMRGLRRLYDIRGDLVQCRDLMEVVSKSRLKREMLRRVCEI